jgi:hypothetical protein
MWIKTLLDTLRKMAPEPGSADVGLFTAGRHVGEYVNEYGGDPQKAIDELIDAFRSEAKERPSEKDFWKAVEEYVALPTVSALSGMAARPLLALFL